jgi:hypothetical protein
MKKGQEMGKIKKKNLARSNAVTCNKSPLLKILLYTSLTKHYVKASSREH